MYMRKTVSSYYAANGMGSAGVGHPFHDAYGHTPCQRRAAWARYAAVGHEHLQLGAVLAMGTRRCKDRTYGFGQAVSAAPPRYSAMAEGCCLGMHMRGLRTFQVRSCKQVDEGASFDICSRGHMASRVPIARAGRGIG